MSQTFVPIVFMKTYVGGFMVSADVSGFEPWPGTLCCVLGKDN